MALALLTFAAAFAAGVRSQLSANAMQREWLAIAAIAVIAGVLAGWTIEKTMLESLGISGWILSLVLAGVSLGSPVLAAAALVSGAEIPSFAQVLARGAERMKQPLPLLLGVMLIVISVLALQLALGLVFDPRYRDFPFAQLTAAAVPYLAVALLRPRMAGAAGTAETLFAWALVACAAYIAVNEGIANWQALWCCAALLALAVTLLRLRGVRS
jgi:glucan 1,3-beta-glucosidase